MAHSVIFEEFKKISQEHPQKNAISFPKNKEFKNISYQQLYNSSIKLANLLTSKGITNQDKIALLLGNQWEWQASFMAAQFISATAVPIDIKLPGDEIKKLIKHCQAKITICAEKVYARIKNDLTNENILIVDSANFFDQINTLNPQSSLDNTGQQIAAMFYTSGTVDLPKAVMLSSDNLLSNFRSIKKLKLTSCDDNFISLLPLHHTYSFMVTCLLPLLQGGQISYPSGLTSEELLTCIKANRITVLTGVPQLFLLLHKSIEEKLNKLNFIAKTLINACWLIRKITKINLNKLILNKLHEKFGNGLRYLVSGGAALDPKIIKDYYKWGFTLLQGYGLTETSPVVTFNTPRKTRFKSAGIALPDVKIKILNPDKNGMGQIAIQGQNVMAGYYNLPEETKKTIQDSWLITEDVGYINNQGFLFITGRKDELIVLSSGEKINPEELEKIYSSSTYIKEICIFPAQEDSFIKGSNKLMAVVIPNEEYFRLQNQANIEEKIKWELENVSARLATSKRISGYIISKESLPRTALGKIMRYKIKNNYLNKTASFGKKDAELSEEEKNLLSNKAALQLIDYLAKRINKKVTLNDHLELDLGLDSLSRIEILLDIQQMLGIEVNEELAMELFYTPTIKDLLIKINPLLPKEITSLNEEKFDWQKALTQIPIEISRNIRLKPTLLDKVVNWILMSFIFIFLKIFFLLTSKNIKNLPRNKAILFYANHTTYLDGLFIATALPFNMLTKTYFVGFKRYFTSIFLRKLIKTARLIPIDINFDLLNALQTCAHILKNNQNICLFPEGQRSIKGEILQFKKGIGILAKELDITLVPVYIQGAHESWPRSQLLPKPSKVKVIFGTPTNVKDLDINLSNPETDAYEAISQALRTQLIKLKNSL